MKEGRASWPPGADRSGDERRTRSASAVFAYVIMSVSPVAAAALTFFDAEVVTNLGAMITGNRLGAGFIVIFVGFIYVLRGRDRAASLEYGLLSAGAGTPTWQPSASASFF